MKPCPAVQCEKRRRKTRKQKEKKHNGGHAVKPRREHTHGKKASSLNRRALVQLHSIHFIFKQNESPHTSRKLMLGRCVGKERRYQHSRGRVRGRTMRRAEKTVVLRSHKRDPRAKPLEGVEVPQRQRRKKRGGNRGFGRKERDRAPRATPVVLVSPLARCVMCAKSYVRRVLWALLLRRQKPGGVARGC